MNWNIRVVLCVGGLVASAAAQNTSTEILGLVTDTSGAAVLGAAVTITRVATGWLVYRLTHSPAYLGAIGFCQQIPVLLLALPAGGTVDRVNRHRLVILTQSLALVQASILTYLTYTGKINLPWLFGMAIFIGESIDCLRVVCKNCGAAFWSDPQENSLDQVCTSSDDILRLIND